jgi:DNA-binding winged helix-turn-helix (wHTH) protein
VVDVGAGTPQEFHFADFRLDQARYRLERGEHRIRLEKLPMELLLLLVERRGELVSREEIAERLWGKDVFVDVDHSINIAVRKIRVALRDDPEEPRFVGTIIGKGYRFAAPVSCANGTVDPQPQAVPPQPEREPVAPPVAQPAKPKIILPRLRMILAGVAVLALLTVGLLLSHRGKTETPMPSPIKKLAVLPLRNLSGRAFINPYLALGDYEQAFVWFERSYREKSNILQFLKVHPFFDPVRSDPRFQDLIRRVGLN